MSLRAAKKQDNGDCFVFSPSLPVFLSLPLAGSDSCNRVKSGIGAASRNEFSGTKFCRNAMKTPIIMADIAHLCCILWN